MLIYISVLINYLNKKKFGVKTFQKILQNWITETIIHTLICIFAKFGISVCLNNLIHLFALLFKIEKYDLKIIFNLVKP